MAPGWRLCGCARGETRAAAPEEHGQPPRRRRRRRRQRGSRRCRTPTPSSLQAPSSVGAPCPAPHPAFLALTLALALGLALAAPLAVWGLFSRRDARLADEREAALVGSTERRPGPCVGPGSGRTPSRGRGLPCGRGGRSGAGVGWGVARAGRLCRAGRRGQQAGAGVGRQPERGRAPRWPATAVLVSIVVSIPACHAGDRGSIPRRGGKTPFLVACAPLGPTSCSRGAGALLLGRPSTGRRRVPGLPAVHRPQPFAWLEAGRWVATAQPGPRVVPAAATASSSATCRPAAQPPWVSLGWEADGSGPVWMREVVWPGARPLCSFPRRAGPGRAGSGPVLYPEPVPQFCAVSSRAPSRITSRGTSSRGTNCVTWQRPCQEASHTFMRMCPGAVARATSRLLPTGTWVSSCLSCAWSGAAERAGG